MLFTTARGQKNKTTSDRNKIFSYVQSEAPKVCFSVFCGRAKAVSHSSWTSVSTQIWVVNLDGICLGLLSLSIQNPLRDYFHRFGVFVDLAFSKNSTETLVKDLKFCQCLLYHSWPKLKDKAGKKKVLNIQIYWVLVTDSCGERIYLSSLGNLILEGLKELGYKFTLFPTSRCKCI